MKLTKAQWEALPEGLKALYKPTGEDCYEPTFITAEDHEQSISGLKKKNEELIGKDKASREAAAAAAAAEAAAKDAADRKNGDVAALDASWTKKMNEQAEQFKTELAGRDAFITKTLVDAKAKELASTLGRDSASVLLPHIIPRLSVEKGEDGNYSTRILDKEGKPSALTMQDLEKEFRSDKAFASVIVEPTSNGLGGGLRDTGAPKSKPDLMGSLAGSGNAMLAEAMKLAGE